MDIKPGNVTFTVHLLRVKLTSETIPVSNIKPNMEMQPDGCMYLHLAPFQKLPLFCWCVGSWLLPGLPLPWLWLIPDQWRKSKGDNVERSVTVTVVCRWTIWFRVLGQPEDHLLHAREYALSVGWVHFSTVLRKSLLIRLCNSPSSKCPTCQQLTEESSKWQGC